MVVRDGRAEAAGARGAARAAASATTRSRSTASRSTSLEDAPDWNISRQIWWGHQLPVWYCPDGHVTVAGDRAGGAAPSAARPSSTRDDGRARHVVLVGALAVRDARLARARRRSSSATTPATLNTTAREIIRLWENRMIFSGLELMGEIPFTRRDHPLDGARAPTGGGCRRASAPGIDPLELIDAARRRRDALRAAEDVLVAGRALLGGRDRGGPQAREQALERRAADPRERRAATPDAAAARRSRSAGSSRGSTQAQRAGRAAASPRSTSRTSTSALYHLTFDDFCDWYAEAIKPRLYDGDADARATALAALERLLEAAASGDAARDRGDLVEPARRASRG